MRQRQTPQQPPNQQTQQSQAQQQNSQNQAPNQQQHPQNRGGVGPNAGNVMNPNLNIPMNMPSQNPGKYYHHIIVLKLILFITFN